MCQNVIEINYSFVPRPLFPTSDLATSDLPLHPTPHLLQRGITVSLTMAMCNNTQRKPGPVFTTATQAAYAAGADWIYRVNDGGSGSAPTCFRTSPTIPTVPAIPTIPTTPHPLYQTRNL